MKFYSEQDYSFAPKLRAAARQIEELGFMPPVLSSFSGIDLKTGRRFNVCILRKDIEYYDDFEELLDEYRQRCLQQEAAFYIFYEPGNGKLDTVMEKWIQTASMKAVPMEEMTHERIIGYLKEYPLAQIFPDLLDHKLNQGVFCFRHMECPMCGHDIKAFIGLLFASRGSENLAEGPFIEKFLPADKLPDNIGYNIFFMQEMFRNCTNAFSAFEGLPDKFPCQPVYVCPQCNTHITADLPADFDKEVKECEKSLNSLLDLSDNDIRLIRRMDAKNFPGTGELCKEA